MSYTFFGFGDDSVDPCVATGPVQAPYASCVGQLGMDAFSKNVPMMALGPGLVALIDALRKSPRPMVPPLPIAPGLSHGSAWGARAAPFEWDGASFHAWLDYMLNTAPMASMSDGGRACDFGLCSELCFGSSSVCVYLNNAYVFAGGGMGGQQSAADYFGGPVLEFLNFRRLLKFLHQRTKDLPAAFASGYHVDPSLDHGLAVAESNLGKLLGPAWTGSGNVATWGPTRDKIVALLTTVPSSQTVRGALNGPPPYYFPEWLNFLRYQAQRFPADPATGYSTSGPYGLIWDVTPLQDALVRNDTTLTIGPGDWLRLVLDLLAPGWNLTLAKTPPVFSKGPLKAGSHPVAAAGHGVAVAIGAAAIGAAALLWTLL